MSITGIINVMNTEPEFAVGDTVTFKPYEKSYKCRVSKIKHNNPFEPGQDSRVFYTLTGPAISKTTGQCILESKLYKVQP